MAQTARRQRSEQQGASSSRFDAWAAGTGSPYDLLADDASWTIVGRSAASKTYPSHEAFIGEVIRPFNGSHERRAEADDPQIYADGDTVIVFFDAAGTARTASLTRTPTPGSSICRTASRQGVRFFDSVEFNDFWSRVQPVAE